MKRKIGLIVGYNGEGFLGLQYNKELNTIEKAIVEVLLSSKCITEINSLDPKKIALKSSSRTDKGVHASFNCVIAKIIQEPTPELYEELRKSLLSKGIHLYKIVKLTKRFVGHKMARSRVYKYIVPTFFFKKDNFEDDYKKLESKRSMMESGLQDDEDKISNDKEDSCGNLNEEKRESFHKKIFRTYPNSLTYSLQGYRSDRIQRFNEILQYYLGTKNFHNFTPKSCPGDSTRIIKSITVSEAFVENDIEFVEVTLHGQSFLLHQIRKMISFAVLNCKYLKNEISTFKNSCKEPTVNESDSKNCENANIEQNFSLAFSSAEVKVPKAPSQYLFLNHIFFDDYNLKTEEKIEILSEEKVKFEKETIYPAVLKNENTLEWFKFFDSVYFHHEDFDYLK